MIIQNLSFVEIETIANTVANTMGSCLVCCDALMLSGKLDGA